MTLWNRFWSWLRAILWRTRVESEMDAELRFHIEAFAEDLARSGVPRQEALRRARIEFGGIEQTKEECRDARGVNFVESLIQDLRFALRMLCKSPGFTAVAVLTLALGIGMNTAVFSVVNAVLLRPLGYPDANRLVWLSDHGDWGDNMVSPAAYILWRDAANSFESMVAYGNQDLALMTAGESTQERIASIADNFWGVTGAQPVLGRLFGPGEPNTMVLSHELLVRTFGGDPRVVGKTITLNGHPFTITGVLPRNFQFLLPQQFSEERREIDAYIPLPDAVLRLWSVTEAQYETVAESAGPTPWAVYVVGKLKPDVQFAGARAEMESIYSRVEQEHYPSWARDQRLHIAPLKEKLMGNTQPALIVIFGAVGFVLLIASANIANLLLARASTRQKEIAIRTAVGAGQGRLISQFLVESILLALLGGTAGLVVARWSLAIMVRLGSEVIPRVAQAKIDGRVLVFTLVTSLGTGLLFGLSPALSFFRRNLHDALKDDAGKLSEGASRLRLGGLLMAAELALGIVLLTAAGLMLKSFWRMNTYPAGFDPEKILVMRVSLYGQQYAVWLQQDAYIRELLRRIASVPGVEAAGVHRGTLNTAVKVEGAPTLPGKEPYAAVQGVSAGYLRAMGAALVRGDWPRDGSFDTFVVNESFVRDTLGHDNPIGRHLSGPVMNGTIVGVVADFKAWQLDVEPSPEVYIPYQLPPGGRSVRVVVRTSGDPELVAPTIQKLASSVDPTKPVYQFQTLDHALSDSIAPRRFNLFLLGTFAAVALAMALVGAYGVISYLVSQRTHEIGIRIALGGRAPDILWLVIGQALRTAGAGIAIGIGGALVLARKMQSLLFGVSATDPMTLAVVVLTLMFVVLLASYVPARRATKVDPMVALRYE